METSRKNCRNGNMRLYDDQFYQRPINNLTFSRYPVLKK